MEERINLRLSTEVYKPYERLAQLLTGMGQPMTATGLVRMLVEAQAEQTEMLCTAAEAAIRGDKEARNSVFDAVMAWNEAQIATARVVEAADRRTDVAAAEVVP
jgi:predicted DNA-binding protein